MGIHLAGQGKIEEATALLQQVIDSGHADAAPNAAVSLGQLLASQGKVLDALAAYQTALDSGHPDWVKPARKAIRELPLEDRKPVRSRRRPARNTAPSYEDAKATLRQYMVQFPEQAHYQALNLGQLLAQHGEIEEAIVVLQQAIDSGNAEAGAPAALSLGALLAQHGRVAEAKVAYQRAIDFGHPDWLEPAKQELRALRSPGR